MQSIPNNTTTEHIPFEYDFLFDPEIVNLMNTIVLKFAMINDNDVIDQCGFQLRKNLRYLLVSAANELESSRRTSRIRIYKYRYGINDPNYCK
jgi:hypothetical protein